MSIFLQKSQKQILSSRCFRYKNVHEAPFTIEKINLFYTIKKDISLKSLARCSSLLELITGQRCSLLRSKNSSIILKVRKGAPIGVRVCIRKARLVEFLQELVWQVLPQIKIFSNKYKAVCLKNQNPSSTNLTIVDPLVFPILKSFYFLFKSCLNLRICFSLPQSFYEGEKTFLKRLLKLPF